jgi:hypothetical protein
VTVQHWKCELESRLQDLVISVPPSSILDHLADDLGGMARSYLSDGDHFLSSGDPVNALASWAYALGWIDAGASLGVFTTRVRDPGWIFSHIHPFPGFESFLREKTARYHALLHSAIQSVVPSPEPDTVMHDAAARFLAASVVSREYGRYFCTLGRLDNALGSFSYGHAWLDSGVRAGLFRVAGKREIFTL